MRIGLAQIDIHSRDLQANIDSYRQRAAEAKDRGCDLIVFPELSDTGFALDAIPHLVSPWPSYEPLVELRDLASRLRINVCAGICEKTLQGIFDSVVLIDAEGALAGSYRKIQLYAPLGETRCFTPGEGPVVARLGEYPVGFMICNDIRFPEISRCLALMGAEVAIVVSAWPFPRVSHWETLLRARAIENQMFVVAVNRVGRVGDMTFCGRSMVIDPHGTTVGASSEDLEGLLVCELRREVLLDVRARLPGIGARRPDAYRGLGGPP